MHSWRVSCHLYAEVVKGMPSDEEFTVCLQKIKMAFNLLVCEIEEQKSYVSFYIIYYINMYMY